MDWCGPFFIWPTIYLALNSLKIFYFSFLVWLDYHKDMMVYLLHCILLSIATIYLALNSLMGFFILVSWLDYHKDMRVYLLHCILLSIESFSISCHVLIQWNIPNNGNHMKPSSVTNISKFDFSSKVVANRNGFVEMSTNAFVFLVNSCLKW